VGTADAQHGPHGDDKEIVVTAEMPGLDDKDFEVTVSGDLLTLKGEKKAEHEQHNGDTHYVERRFLDGVIDPTTYLCGFSALNEALPL
jgi:hypothetical protein